MYTCMWHSLAENVHYSVLDFKLLKLAFLLQSPALSWYTFSTDGDPE